MARYGQDGYGSDHRIGDMTVGDYANGMPNIRLGEMFRSFGRQLRWVIPLFIIGGFPAWYLTKDIKRTYQANGSIYVKPSGDHIYVPIGGNQNAQGVVSTIDSVAQIETSILKNNEVVERVIGEMVDRYGESKFSKSAYDKINAARRSGNSLELANATVELHKTVERNFVVIPQPKSSVISLLYKHEDGEVAVATLNAFIDQYLAYRRTLFVEGAAEVYLERIIATEEQLESVESRTQAFLRRNGIADYASERTGASARTEGLRTEMNTIRAQLSETEAALSTVDAQLRDTPDQISQFTEDMAGQRVVQAELELKQLLAKYLPGSDPVRAKQAEITELKALQSADGGGPKGRTRIGPNPTYQALLTRRNTLASTADSLREKEFTVQQLLNGANAKVQKLGKIYPEYNNLLREAETLDQRLKGYNDRYQEALINQEQAEVNSENVKVIEYATLPRKGRNMQKIMFALMMIGWGFTLFMLALLKVFLDPRLYTDPTRRLRARPTSSFDDFGYDDLGQPVPARNPAQPYIPEPVPMQPAAAQYQDPYLNPGAYPPAQTYAPQQAYAPQQGYAQPYHDASAYQAVPYAGNVAYDVNPNPYTPPQPFSEPPQTGELPASETD